MRELYKDPEYKKLLKMHHKVVAGLREIDKAHQDYWIKVRARRRREMVNRHRKFQIGDTVKVTKPGRYGKRLGMVGIVEDYRLRKYEFGNRVEGNYYNVVGGSCYQVRFPDRVIWVETEYLSGVKL